MTEAATSDLQRVSNVRKIGVVVLLQIFGEIRCRLVQRRAVLAESNNN